MGLCRYFWEGDHFLLVAKTGGESHLIDEGLEGLLAGNGEVALPLQYRSISFHEDLIIARCNRGSTLFRYIRKQ